MTVVPGWRLAEVFVDVSDTMIDDFDLAGFLHMVTAHCAEVAGASAVGLILADPPQGLRFMASSHEDARMLELFQLHNKEGPCLEAFRTGVAVLDTDLRGAWARWPRFATAATAAGIRSVHAFPLRLRDQVIGTLNVFGAEDGARLVDDDLPIVQALADVTAIALLRERAQRRGEVLADQLQRALDTRVVIEQAKGVVAQARTISLDQAFSVIRSYARSHNQRLSDVARGIVTDVDRRSTGVGAVGDVDQASLGLSGL